MFTSVLMVLLASQYMAGYATVKDLQQVNRSNERLRTSCPDTFQFEDKAYRIVGHRKTWRGAQRKCAKLEAGILAEPKTDDEHRFIQDILNQHDKCHNSQCPEHSYWIGAHQTRQPRNTPNEDRIFQWVSSRIEVSRGDNWHDGEPNNWNGHQEKCAQYAPGYWFGNPDVGYLINDRRCAEKYCFVCEQ